MDVLPEQEKTVDYVINKIKVYKERETEETIHGKIKNLIQTFLRVRQKRTERVINVEKLATTSTNARARGTLKIPGEALEEGGSSKREKAHDISPSSSSETAAPIAEAVKRQLQRSRHISTRTRRSIVARSSERRTKEE